MATVRLEPTYAKARREILKGLIAYNQSRIGKRPWKRFAVTVRDDAGAIVGGVCGEAWCGWLFVQLLWIDERCRGEGLASRAIGELEEAARRFGCTHAYVDTFSFQARPFYEKLGYKLFGELRDYPPGHARYWLSKTL